MAHANNTDERFHWTVFYEAIAEKLLGYQHNRKPLAKGLHKILEKLPPEDRTSDDTMGPFQDVSPFTTLAAFNRIMSKESRRNIARELAQFLDVEVEAPKSFESIPVLGLMGSWTLGPDKNKDTDDIDTLWKVFATTSHFVKPDQPQSYSEFNRAYDAATEVKGVGWNLSIGLHWAHPRHFPSLNSRFTSLP